MSVSTQVGPHHVTVRRASGGSPCSPHGLAHHQDLVDHFGDDWVRGPNQNAPQLPPHPQEEVLKILVTGSSGFIGGHLLRAAGRPVPPVRKSSA
jgi:hypothetical protein